MLRILNKDSVPGGRGVRGGLFVCFLRCKGPDKSISGILALASGTGSVSRCSWLAVTFLVDCKCGAVYLQQLLLQLHLKSN